MNEDVRSMKMSDRRSRILVSAISDNGINNQSSLRQIKALTRLIHERIGNSSLSQEMLSDMKTVKDVLEKWCIENRRSDDDNVEVFANRLSETVNLLVNCEEGNKIGERVLKKIEEINEEAALVELNINCYEEYNNKRKFSDIESTLDDIKTSVAKLADNLKSDTELSGINEKMIGIENKLEVINEQLSENKKKMLNIEKFMKAFQVYLGYDNN